MDIISEEIEIIDNVDWVDYPETTRDLIPASKKIIMTQFCKIDETEVRLKCSEFVYMDEDYKTCEDFTKAMRSLKNQLKNLRQAYDTV